MGGQMSVYVRLSDTVEDTLAAFTGCVDCAHPLPADGVGGLKCYIRACPSCGRRDRTDLYDGRTLEWVNLRWWNPTVVRDESGGLEVRKGGSVVAYYPPGAWTSYRSD